MFSSYYSTPAALPAYAPESGIDLSYKTRFNVPSTQQLNQSMLLKQQINPLDAIIGNMERSQPVFDPSQYRMANMSRFGGYPLESTCHPSAAWTNACKTTGVCSPLDSMIEKLQNEKLAQASLASFDPSQYRMANMSRFGGYPLESTCHPSAAWTNACKTTGVCSPLDSMIERLQNEKLAQASLASFDAPFLGYSQGYSQVFPQGISTGVSPISLASRNPWAVSGSESFEKKNILQGLTLDHLKNIKAHAVIDDALCLLKGTRQTDKVWNALNSGVNVPPEIVSEAIKVDRIVDARVADLVQKMLNYRRRNTEAIDVSENLLAGKMYHGVKANPIEQEMNAACHFLVNKELASLYALSGRL